MIRNASAPHIAKLAEIPAGDGMDGAERARNFGGGTPPTTNAPRLNAVGLPERLSSLQTVLHSDAWNNFEQ